MSIEGLWAAEFGHAGANFIALNGGIAVLESGRVFGGDGWFAYTGEYELKDGRILGKARIKRHKHDPESIDAWETGEDLFDVHFELALSADHRLAEGQMIRANLPALGLRLRKLTELP